MEKAYQGRIRDLKLALLKYLGVNGRHYGDLTRLEQSVEDLAQALNTRLDQLLLCVEGRGEPQPAQESPGERLASRFLETANKLNRGGKVDAEVADEFERTLDMFDLSADLKRQSATAKDVAETAAIKHKRNKS